MAKVESLFNLNGKLGNHIFSTVKGKKVVRSVSSRPHVQPEASRKSGKDFGAASSAAALIRQGFKPLTQVYADNEYDDRLKRLANQVVLSGPERLKGARQFTDGNMALLKGLELNKHTAVSKLLPAAPVVTTVAGNSITIALPKLYTEKMFFGPEKAAAAVIQFRCCLLYFTEKRGLYVTAEDLIISLAKETFPGGSFSLPLEGADNCVILLAWGIHFTAKNDQRMINNRKYYAANLLEVVHLENGAIKVFEPEVSATTAVAAVNTVPQVQWTLDEE
ncbi:hypothetical protein HNQ91_001218 [Filimonas zeae]|uniref:Uncharacterized protein n=1 Tax=Filimonas zeae TaxID=1737353 RepID=A0A917MST7_9BACT|nr:hypothetical protein [Filimonas zeae]MDR6338196.1 hypothetical protein [Filimonas zeae]GGH62189.1 hypothetical protein GCM10011379_11920 [Filimonas zeae]